MSRVSTVLLFLLGIAVLSTAQLCHDTDQYARCSANSACGCFHMVHAERVGVCGFLWPTCSQLEPCDPSNNDCQKSDSICVQHPRCQNHPVCYPVSMISEQLCPARPAVNNTTTIETTMTTTFATTIATTEEIVETSTAWPYGPTDDVCPDSFTLSCNVTSPHDAQCEAHEVSWNNHCYYLDGSNGACIAGYRLATNAVLGCIASRFQAKNYRYAISNSCCITTADKYQCYGFQNDCNKAGPFSTGPTLGGGGCRNNMNRQSRQLTLCESI